MNGLPRGLRKAAKFFQRQPHKKKLMVSVFIQGSTIRYATNLMKTSPQSSARNNFQHCEFVVLSGIPDPSKGKLFIYRERQDNKLPAMARPCHYCLQMLREKGVSRVWYSTDNGWAKEKIL